MIEVENLTRLYGPRTAIKNISFKIDKGDVVGFLGPNGAGKSTTMNILCSILPASSGTVRIGGHDIFDQSLEVRKIIGYLPETPPLYHEMVVSKYLQYAAGLRQMAHKKIAAAVDRVLERCGLKEVRHRIIGRLSKGYQQRVGLAQAMVHDPEILILDEPTIGLDPKQIIEIRNLIRELGKTHTIILSSHILPEVTQVCQRVIIINEGEIAAMDSLEGLTASLRNTRRLQLKVRNGADGIVQQLEALANVLTVHSDSDKEFTIETTPDSHLQEDIARLALDRQWGLEEIRPLAMTLEDVFLKLTTDESEGPS